MNGGLAVWPSAPFVNLLSKRKLCKKGVSNA